MVRPPRSMVYHYLREQGRDTETATEEADEIVTLLEEAGHIPQPATAGAAHGS